MSAERIHELEVELRRLQGMVFQDELTGMLNRRGFVDRVDQIFQFIRQHHDQERRHGVRIPFSVIFIDLDNFKQINDEYGHGMGDAALKHAAQVFARTVRQGDVIARFGGEEFVVALHAVTIDDAEHVAEKIRHALELSPCVHEGVSLPLTASFGVAEYRVGDDTLEQLIKRADEAMYEAKRAGKNRVVVAL
jgi:diguanylate cyclase (GGDEF)-like protein